MKRKLLLSILIPGALVIATVVGVTTVRTVNAAAPEANSYLPAGHGRGPGGGVTNEDLANALGISVDELSAAYTEANDAALDQAVEEGLVTQAQADELRVRGAAFPLGGRLGGWLSRSGIDYQALLAEALGISEEELQAAYTEAHNTAIDRAVTEGNLTEEQADLLKGRNALFSNDGFRSAMQSAFEAAVNQAVEDGVITQSQADQILAAQSEMGFPGLHGFGGFGGPHGFGGRHGGDEFRFGDGPEVPAPTQPATPSPSGFSG